MINLKIKENLIKLRGDEYKYLSPFIFKFKSKYFLFFCNRKNQNTFQGVINLIYSKNLIKWNRVRKFEIKPKKNSSIISYTSPCVLKKHFFYLYVQAQNKNLRSKIIRFKSKNFKSWKVDKSFELEEKGYSVKSPFHSLCDKNYLYFSKENKKNSFICKMNLTNHKIINLFRSETKNENYSMYSPTISKYKKTFIMLYSAWKNSLEGNIKIAFSKNLKKWYKSENYIFNLPKKIKIISEPNIFIKSSYLYIFYEFKKNFKNWSIAFNKIKIKRLIKNKI